MRLVICGGRTYMFSLQDYQYLNKLRKELEVTEVVCGGALGADTCGRAWAIHVGLPTKVFAADWDTHGKAAGPIRNRQMAEYGDALVAFPGGRGTKNMLAEAQAKGLQVIDLSEPPF